MDFFQEAIEVLNSIIAALKPGRSKNWPLCSLKRKARLNFMQPKIRTNRRIIKWRYIRRLLVPP